MSKYTNREKTENDYMNKYYTKKSYNNNYIKNRFCSSILNIPKIQKGKLGVISNKSLVWDRDDPAPLKIHFLNIPDNPADPQSILPRTFNERLKTGNVKRDDNDNIINWDPLELQFYNNKTNIIDAIKEIIRKRYQPLVNFRFEFIDEIKDYKYDYIKHGVPEVRIKFDKDDGCSSFVGKDCLKISMKLPTMKYAWFDVGTILHEFGHALGLLHEHKTPFGNKIKWNIDVIKAEYPEWDDEEIKFQITDPYFDTVIEGTAFDPESIMLYFYPAKFTLDGEGTSENMRLSRKDVFFINRLYGNLSEEEVDKYYINTYGRDKSSFTT